MSRQSDSSVQITSSKEGQSVLGTGFVVTSAHEITYVATCAHVVHDVGGFDHIKVAGQKAEVVNRCLLEGLDLAVLSTTPPLKKSGIRLQLTAEIEDEVSIQGFSKVNDMSAFGQINGKITRVREIEYKNERIRMWDLQVDDELEPGYSGSPVVYKESNCAIAVAILRQGDRTGIAISVEGLRLLWEDISELFIQNPPFTLPTEDRLVKDINYFIQQSEKNKTTQRKRLENLYKQRNNIEREILNIRDRIAKLQRSMPFNILNQINNDDTFREQMQADKNISSQLQTEINKSEQKQEELQSELETIDEDIAEDNTLREYYEERSAFEKKLLDNSIGRTRRLENKIGELQSRREKTLIENFITSVILSDIERYSDYLERFDT